MTTEELFKLNNQLTQCIKDENNIYNEIKKLDDIIVKMKLSPINKITKSNMLKVSLRRADYNKRYKYLERKSVEMRLRMAKINWVLKFNERNALCKETTDISILEKHDKLLAEAEQTLKTAKEDMEKYPSKYFKISLINDPQLKKFRNN